MLKQNNYVMLSKCTMVLLLASALALTGCGGGGGGTDTGGSTGGGTTTTTAAVDAISVGTSASSIKTDGSDDATITAIVLDSSKKVIPNVDVTFSSNGGVLFGGSTKTDADGKATIKLNNGSTDYGNRTVTVSATASGKTSTVPVAIAGSTLTLTASATSAQVGTSTITLSAAAKDAKPQGRFAQTVRFSAAGSGTTPGAGTLSTSSTTTDATGLTPTVTFTPTSAGTVVLTADWLDSSGAVTVQSTQTVTVTGAAGVAFAIASPASDPHAMSTSATQAVNVTVPTAISGTNVASVRFTSTSGTWSASSQNVAANAASSTFTAPSNSGTVTVQVDAMSGAGGTGSVLSSLSRSFAVSAPAASAAKINIQTSVSTISPSTTNNKSTAVLTATVRDASDNAVGDAPVAFELLGTTGSGETVTPAVVYTNSSGQAVATFTAGTVPTQGAVHVRAKVAGQTCTGSPHTTPSVAETNGQCNAVPVTVASSAGGISLGFSTVISENSNKTQYVLPGSVLVVNASGGPVEGATVTLSVFPSYYRNGSITVGASGCVAPTTTFIANEDANRNMILDPGEDAGLALTAAQSAAGAKPANGIISPARSDGGSLPTTVVTDKNGAATFDLQYLKGSAYFIVAEVTATLNVSGTERSVKTEFMLPPSKADAATENECPLARSGAY